MATKKTTSRVVLFETRVRSGEYEVLPPKDCRVTIKPYSAPKTEAEAIKMAEDLRKIVIEGATHAAALVDYEEAVASRYASYVRDMVTALECSEHEVRALLRMLERRYQREERQQAENDDRYDTEDVSMATRVTYSKDFAECLYHDIKDYFTEDL